MRFILKILFFLYRKSFSCICGTLQWHLIFHYYSDGLLMVDFTLSNIVRFFEIVQELILQTIECKIFLHWLELLKKECRLAFSYRVINRQRELNRGPFINYVDRILRNFNSHPLRIQVYYIGLCSIIKIW